jgi:SulP family sulfate permease
VLAGIIQILAGLFKLGKLMRIVPHPVIYGFVNGLAILFYVTIESIQGCIRQLVNRSVFIYFGFGATNYAYHLGLPKLTKAIPASLIAILAVLEVVGFGIDTKTVGDASIQGGFPPFHPIYHSIWKP